MQSAKLSSVFTIAFQLNQVIKIFTVQSKTDRVESINHCVSKAYLYVKLNSTTTSHDFKITKSERIILKRSVQSLADAFEVVTVRT